MPVNAACSDGSDLPCSAALPDLQGIVGLATTSAGVIYIGTGPFLYRMPLGGPATQVGSSDSLALGLVQVSEDETAVFTAQLHGCVVWRLAAGALTVWAGSTPGTCLSFWPLFGGSWLT